MTKSVKSDKSDASAEGAFAHFRRFYRKTTFPSDFWGRYVRGSILRKSARIVKNDKNEDLAPESVKIDEIAKSGTFAKSDMACTRLPLAQTTFGRCVTGFVSFDQKCQKVTPTLDPDFESPRVLLNPPGSGKTLLVAPPKWLQASILAVLTKSAQKGCTPRKPTAQRMDLYAMYLHTQSFCD